MNAKDEELWGGAFGGESTAEKESKERLTQMKLVQDYEELQTRAEQTRLLQQKQVLKFGSNSAATLLCNSLAK